MKGPWQAARAVALSFALGLAGSLTSGCATALLGGAPAPREVPSRCPQGPYCVAGEVNDVFGAPLPGVRCIVRPIAGPPAVAETDGQGLFLIDGLPEAPSFLQFEGRGVVTETKTLVRNPAGEASRVFMVLARSQGDAQVSPPNRR